MIGNNSNPHVTTTNHRKRKLDLPYVGLGGDQMNSNHHPSPSPGQSSRSHHSTHLSHSPSLLQEHGQGQGERKRERDGNERNEREKERKNSGGGSEKGSEKSSGDCDRNRYGSERDYRTKRRFVWPDSLHCDFIRAIFSIGIIHCNPSMLKSILGNKYPESAIETCLHKLKLYNAHQMSQIEKKNTAKRIALSSENQTGTGYGLDSTPQSTDEITNMNKSINSQIELIERFRQSLLKQMAIRDKLISMNTSTQHETVQYIQDGVDLGRGLIDLDRENELDNSDGSSTRSNASMIVPASHPRSFLSSTSPSFRTTHSMPSNTSGVSNVASATRHIVMPPPSGVGSIRSNRRLSSNQSSISDGYDIISLENEGEIDGTGSYDGNTQHFYPNSASAASLFQQSQSNSPHASNPANSPPPACDPTAVSRHRSELYMVSAMRSHMNMHRELLQFNSQYTTPVQLDVESQNPSSMSYPMGGYSHPSSDMYHVIEPPSPAFYPSQGENEHLPLLSSAPYTELSDPSISHPHPRHYPGSVPQTDDPSPSLDMDHSLLSITPSSPSHSYPFHSPTPQGEDDEDLDSSLFDFLF